MTTNNDAKIGIYLYGGFETKDFRNIFSIHPFYLQDRRLSKLIYDISPPLTDMKNFIAFFVYRNPIDSIIYMCNNKLADTMNRLAGKIIFENRDAVSLDKLLSYNCDILRLTEHYYTWQNSSRNYPIAFFNYDKLTSERLQSISKTLKDKYNINANEELIKKFEPTQTSYYKSLSSEQLDKFNKIYHYLILKINEDPDFQINDNFD